MPDQAEHDREGEVFAAAVGAARAVLGDVPEETVAEALRAAGEVLDEYDQAHAEKLVGETLLAGVEGGALRLVLARELAARMTLAFKTILDASPGVENYVEQEIFERETHERYLFIVCKPRGRTPHQLRRAAETERDQLRATVNRVRAFADVMAAESPKPGPGGFIAEGIYDALAADRAVAGGGAGNPAQEDQPPTPDQTEESR